MSADPGREWRTVIDQCRSLSDTIGNDFGHRDTYSAPTADEWDLLIGYIIAAINDELQKMGQALEDIDEAEASEVVPILEKYGLISASCKQRNTAGHTGILESYVTKSGKQGKVGTSRPHGNKASSRKQLKNRGDKKTQKTGKDTVYEAMQHFITTSQILLRNILAILTSYNVNENTEHAQEIIQAWINKHPVY